MSDVYALFSESLSFPEHEPGDGDFPLLMWIVVDDAYVVFLAILCAVVYIIITSCDVYGIFETIFPECIGEVPEGFFALGGDEIESVIIANTSNGSAFHLPMQEETLGDSSVADKYELPEERASVLLYIVFYFLASRNTDDSVVAKHGHIPQTFVVALQFLAINDQ